LWKNEGALPKLPQSDAPIISPNIAKFKPANSSWSWDMQIMDFANDDDFTTGWESNKSVAEPWLEIELGNSEQPFNMITITEKKNKNDIQAYKLEYLHNNKWEPIFSGTKSDIIKVHRFNRVWGNKVRITIEGFRAAPTIAELGVYDERR
jgi:alpha-L-fucosidase